MNNNAIAKFGEAKFCILFCLVPHASVLHGIKERCMSVAAALAWSHTDVNDSFFMLAETEDATQTILTFEQQG